MATFGWSADFIRKKLPGAQGWVYMNWARENDIGLFGSGEERKTPGYVAQERLKLKAEIENGKRRSIC